MLGSSRIVALRNIQEVSRGTQCLRGPYLEQGIQTRQIKHFLYMLGRDQFQSDAGAGRP